MKTLLFIFAFTCSLLKAQPGLFYVYSTSGTYTMSSPNNSYTLTCDRPQLLMTAFCSSSILVTYSWTSFLYFSTGSNATLTIPGIYTVTAQTGTSTLTQTLSVLVNTTLPVSSASSTFQVLTSTSIPQSFTFTAISPTVNTSHFIYTPYGGQQMAPGLSIVYTAVAPGTYTHCIRDDLNGCESCHFFGWAVSAPGNFVGLNEKEILTERIYPNPSKRYFKFDRIPGSNPLIEVYNLSGVLLKRADLSESDMLLDLQEQVAGIYVVKVFNEQGIPFFLKLIKDD